ncbi:hypothetical protein BC936DRAFT_148408 [Jimgerdemannia flammicorona]|uniref:Uncharacterized protein n=1 Tax=Jimgerdemannia flammicorona TaxID=994334 RepID=A0A433D333_9FUNG|nr:hypothetical protein BC936DRAFT_148408 [Jimgerdemannia flammicorona]
MKADIVCSRLGIVHSSPGSQMRRPSIGVIAPYAAQVALLESKLSDTYSSDTSVKSKDKSATSLPRDRTRPEKSTTTVLTLPSCHQQLPDARRISERLGSTSIVREHTVIFPAKVLTKTSKQDIATAFNTNIW